MRGFFCAVFVCICSSAVSGQRREIDSLNKLLPALRDTARINCLNTLGKYYCNHFNESNYSRTDSAELCVKKAYAEAIELNYKAGVADALINLDLINGSRFDFGAAQNYAQKAVLFCKEIRDEGRLSEAYITLADALWYEGDISSEINALDAALRYYKDVKDTSEESLILDWLSECYVWKGDFEKGYEYLLGEINLKKKLV